MLMCSRSEIPGFQLFAFNRPALLVPSPPASYLVQQNLCRVKVLVT